MAFISTKKHCKPCTQQWLMQSFGELSQTNQVEMSENIIKENFNVWTNERNRQYIKWNHNIR